MVDLELEIRNCAHVLLEGGVILYPTDTVWGLGCDATNAAAVQKIFEIKRRPGTKSMIVLLAEEKDILHYVAAPPPDIIAMLEEFTSPTTVIYDGALGLADGVTAEDGSVAIRICHDPFCKALIKRIKKPLISTSANISGEPAPSVYSEISPDVLSGADYTVKYRQDDDIPKKPSRIIKMNDDGSYTIIRP